MQKPTEDKYSNSSDYILVVRQFRAKENRKKLQLKYTILENKLSE